MKNMKIIDLFCGCGGLSKGFENAGFDIVFAIDFWKDAIQIFFLYLLYPLKEDRNKYLYLARS